MLNFIDKDFEREWNIMAKEYEEMKKRNEEFRKNWEKNVRAMGAASFFGLNEEEPVVILDSMGSTVNIKDDKVVADVEYREVINHIDYIDYKEV